MRQKNVVIRIMVLASAGFIFNISEQAFGQVAKDCEYKPFDYVVMPNTSPPGGSIEAPLKFAQTDVKDATSVESDAPFFLAKDQGKDLVWTLAPKVDSRLASENTMLEFYGYFQSVLGSTEEVKGIRTAQAALPIPDGFLTQDTMNGFEGLTSYDFVRFPRGVPTSTKIAEVTRKVFSPQGDTVLKRMIERNSNPGVYGKPFFSRPSFMSSAGTRAKYGDGTLLLCMTLAYAQDTYINPDPQIRSSIANVQIAYQPLRASLIDALAGRAMEEKPVHFPVTQDFANGKISCRLDESKDFRLERTVTYSCPTLVQKQPVVRSGAYETEYKNRFVQLGDKLLEATCTASGKSISLSRSPDEAGTKEVLQALLSASVADVRGGKSDLSGKLKEGIGAFDKLGSPEAASYVTSASKICDADLTNEGEGFRKLGAIRLGAPVGPSEQTKPAAGTGG